MPTNNISGLCELSVAVKVIIVHACECAVNTVRCYELKNAQNLSANCWWFTCFTVTIKSLFIFSWRNASAIPSTTYFIYTRVTHSLSLCVTKFLLLMIYLTRVLAHSLTNSQINLWFICNYSRASFSIITKILISINFIHHEKRDDKHTKVVANNNFCAQHDRKINELYSNEYRSRLLC